ncbi:hypothetical protein EVAR_83277_1 [Eumeta japonica]|uniref:Uncharacterized protein n=1 Tax=Eumeta variegata TaxID=151549 RepID=A0A4C1X6Z8_EUMVA|nr:hypothetical protein EVAR_83277_1 [Eumeta japonica]
MENLTPENRAISSLQWDVICYKKIRSQQSPARAAVASEATDSLARAALARAAHSKGVSVHVLTQVVQPYSLMGMRGDKALHSALLSALVIESVTQDAR